MHLLIVDFSVEKNQAVKICLLNQSISQQKILLLGSIYKVQSLKSNTL